MLAAKGRPGRTSHPAHHNVKTNANKARPRMVKGEGLTPRSVRSPCTPNQCPMSPRANSTPKG